MRDFIKDDFWADTGKVIIDSFPSPAVPFQEADDGTAPAKVGGQLGSGDADEFLGHGVGIISNHHAAMLPHDPVQIWDSSFHVLTATVRADRFANGAAPIVDAGESDWQKPELARRPMMGQAPQGQRLELAFS